MPEMDGFAFKRKLNIIPNGEKIPVIVISALQEQDNKALAFGLGCVDYMVKPINKAEVNSRVDVQIKMIEQQEQLLEQNRQLAEANRTREKIFSIISHDLRTSLGNIRTIFKYILDKTIKPDDARDLIINAEITSGNAFNLLDNLLYWAKSQQGQIIYKSEKVNVDEVIENIAIVEQNSMNKKHLSFKKNIGKDYTIITDKVLFSIAFRNLLVNAIKFTADGGEISIFKREKEDSVELIVKDSGIGISKENLNKINSNRLITTIGTDEEKGTGLGMVLIKDCIDACKGELTVKSKVGVGSEFIITLPNQN